MAAPALLLLAVVGAGVLGPRPQAVPPTPSPTAAEAPSAAAADPAPPSADPSADPSAGPAIAARTEDVHFPATIASLHVRPVSATLQARWQGRGPAIVAIAGYLRAWADPRACANPVPGLPGEGCPREAVLGEHPWASGTSASAIGPHLHAVIPPGVLVPDAVTGLPAADGKPPPPVVVIGRFGDTNAGCTTDLPGVPARPAAASSGAG